MLSSSFWVWQHCQHHKKALSKFWISLHYYARAAMNDHYHPMEPSGQLYGLLNPPQSFVTSSHSSFLIIITTKGVNVIKWHWNYKSNYVMGWIADELHRVLDQTAVEGNFGKYQKWLWLGGHTLTFQFTLFKTWLKLTRLTKEC